MSSRTPKSHARGFHRGLFAIWQSPQALRQSADTRTCEAQAGLDIHRWIFAAVSRGRKRFFREQGIDLKIQEGKGTVLSAATVANGSDDFGYFDIGSVSLLIDKGLAA